VSQNVDAEARLKEIEDRLLAIRRKLLDAASRAALAGRIRAKIDEQLASVEQMLDAIHAHMILLECEREQAKVRGKQDPHRPRSAARA
jgi:hypothetical protein